MSVYLFDGQKKELCNQILRHKKGLLSPSKTDSLNTCTALINQFRNLNEVTTRALNSNSSKVKKVENKLITTDELFTKTYQDYQTSEENLKALNTKSIILKSTEKSLRSSVEETKAKVKKLTDKVRESKTTRIDALTDVIPGVGFFTGLVTRRYTRMIPFYSSIKGIISFLKRDLESFRTTLAIRKNEHQKIENQISKNNSQILQITRSIQYKKEAINELDKKKQELNVKTKETGKNLTQLNNISKSLKEMMIKYEFLQMDVRNIKDFIESDCLQEEMVTDFINDVKKIQMTHLILT